MFLDTNKLRDFLEERINWLKYGTEEKAEVINELAFYDAVMEKVENNTIGKLIPDARAAIKSLDFVHGKSEELVSKLDIGDFDLFDENERE
jgi:hypothetical protein